MPEHSDVLEGNPKIGWLLFLIKKIDTLANFTFRRESLDTRRNALCDVGDYASLESWQSL